MIKGKPKIKNNKIRLGVNVDHVATLRQVRGGTTNYPDLRAMCEAAAAGGADQITIHLREDRRHIQMSDLVSLSQSCPLELNLEMAATPAMVRCAFKYKPDWVCIVPESREELTTEGGLNLITQKEKLTKLVEKLQPIGIEISFFIEPSVKQVRAAYELGADAVEFHTGKWVRLQGEAKAKEWAKLCDAAQLTNELGMGVHAGHGLDYQHALWIAKLPYLREVNIGHSLVCYALESGMKTAVKTMKRYLSEGCRARQ